jgi:1-acyl-sn-glycerol-3-phosphate acyltransferase
MLSVRMSEVRKVGVVTRIVSVLIRDPLIYFYTVVLGTLSLLSSFFDKTGEIQHGFARLWSRLILVTSQTPLTVEGLDKIDTSKPYIYAANHSSALDIPALYAALPFQFRIMAKRELFRYPFLGWHLKRSGQIAIERENARASMRSLATAALTLKHGMPLMVFPEGGRSTDGVILPFLGGTFYVGIKAKVPIVPVAVIGTLQALPMNHYIIKPYPFRVVLGEPISTEGYTPRDMEKLSARMRAALEDLFYSHGEIADPRSEEDIAEETQAAE